MKKALRVVALCLVPFLSQGEEVSNIFEDGTVILLSPLIKIENIIITATDPEIIGDTFASFTSNSCVSYYTDFYSAQLESTAFRNPRGTLISESESTRGIKCEHDAYGDYACPGGHGDYCNFNGVGTIGNYFVTAELREIETCPPPSAPTFILPYDSVNTRKCADPAQINNVDSCSIASGNEYLTIEVSAPSGCFPQADGSICKYNAVDIGGGNEYYALDLEGDCYSNLDGLPNLDGTPKDSPVNDECIDYGGGAFGCPTDPSDVCSSGSAYAGGSIADCPTGCGMVNNQFLCIDQDTDGDGLPDFNDPDIDGDGIPNEDDLDSNGDGKDDPVNGGSGSDSISLDLGPVIKEIKKSNDSLDAIEEAFDTKHGQTPDDLNIGGRLDELNNDYKLDLENFIAKGSQELGYVDKLTLPSMSGFADTVTNRGCNTQAINIPQYGEWSIDFCALSQKVEPILYFVFAILTVFYIFYRVNDTLRL